MNANKPLSVLAIIALLVLAACDGDSRPFIESVEVQSLDLIGLDAVPPVDSLDDIFLNTGQQIQMGLQGTTTSGTSLEVSAAERSWFSTDSSVLGVTENGLVTALTEGEARVFAVLGGISSTGFPITVQNETLTAISRIEGDNVIERCIPDQYRAFGRFSLGTERELDAVTWSLSDDSVGITENPDATATITAVNSGSVDLTAAVGTLNLTQTVQIADSLTGVEVSPPEATINVGAVSSFVATGVYNIIDSQGAEVEDGGTRQVTVTNSVAWAITNGNDFATVVNSGLEKGQVTGRSAGVAILTAACGDESATSSITVQQSVVTPGTDQLSFNVPNGGDLLTLGLNSPTPFRLRVSTGSSYDEDRDVTREVEWSNNFSGNGTAVIELPVNSVSNDFATIRPVAIGEIVLTATRDGRAANLRVRIVN